MIRGMLSGTETLQQAFRKMLQGLFMDFVTAMERMVEQWLRRRRVLPEKQKCFYAYVKAGGRAFVLCA